jgi:hypothetical protein
MNTNEVQHVTQRAHGLRHGRDRADLRGVSPLMRSSPGSVSSISAGTVLGGDNGGGENEDDYVHLQVCNSCREVRLFCTCSRERGRRASDAPAS